MTVETDSDRAEMLEDFGITATINATHDSVVGIFDKNFQSFDNDLTLSGTTPMILCRSIDVSDLINGDTLRINNITYTVRDTEPDGTGMTQVILKR